MSTAERIAVISQAEIKQLESLYNLRGRDGVVQFLQDHPFLVPYLLELPDQIQEHFPAASLSLKFVPDPEEPGLDHLTVGIATDLSGDIEAAMDRLDEFDEESLPNTEPDVLMKVLIDLEPL